MVIITGYKSIHTLYEKIFIGEKPESEILNAGKIDLKG